MYVCMYVRVFKQGGGCEDAEAAVFECYLVVVVVW